MVLNDFKEDFGRMCEINGKTKSQIASEMGVTRQLLNKYQDYAGMNKRFVEMMETLGYDIEIQYVKRR